MTAAPTIPNAEEAVHSRPAAAPGSHDVLLQLDNVHTYYGQIHALQGISLEVRRGEIVTLIGANGAGKTTTLKTISGLLHPRQGKVRFEGRDISRTPAHELVRAGIGHSPEGRRIFSRLTILENLKMGAFTRPQNDIQGDLDHVFELFPRLKERIGQRGGSLSGGEQQMLSLGRALAVGPKLLIADEMSLGLAPLVVDLVFDSLEQVRQTGISVLLIEQFVHRALEMADDCVILSRGRVGWTGRAAEAGPELLDRYLGEAASSAV
jgi:branched-chain amino acid transport system ATP-binding protein